MPNSDTSGLRRPRCGRWWCELMHWTMESAGLQWVTAIAVLFPVVIVWHLGGNDPGATCLAVLILHPVFGVLLSAGWLGLKCCLWRLAACCVPTFAEFRQYCAPTPAVGDRVLWSVGEALQEQLGRRRRVSYCVPLPALGECLYQESNRISGQFRASTVQLLVTTARGRVICALDVTAPEDRDKERMLGELGIRYRRFASGVQAAELKAFVRERRRVRAEPSPFFRPRETLLEPLQLHFLQVMLQPLARTWGARVLLHADALTATGCAKGWPGLSFDFLLTSLDGRYAIGISMCNPGDTESKSKSGGTGQGSELERMGAKARSRVDVWKRKADGTWRVGALQPVQLYVMCDRARAMVNVWPREFNLGSFRQMRLLAHLIRDQMRVNAGLRPDTDQGVVNVELGRTPKPRVYILIVLAMTPCWMLGLISLKKIDKYTKTGKL